MLCIGRHQDQIIEIGPDVTVKVLSIIGNKVVLGVDAPKSVAVHRREVADAIRRETRPAARVKPADATPTK